VPLDRIGECAYRGYAEPVVGRHGQDPSAIQSLGGRTAERQLHRTPAEQLPPELHEPPALGQSQLEFGDRPLHLRRPLGST
jgi:hypothetical protein